MDPHNDFDKQDFVPDDIARATNTAYAELKQELIGANEMKAKFEQSAAEGWAKYRELKAAVQQVRERYASYRLQRPRSFNGEMADEVALEREDQLMDSFLRDLDSIAP